MSRAGVWERGGRAGGKMGVKMWRKFYRCVRYLGEKKKMEGEEPEGSERRKEEKEAS